MWHLTFFLTIFGLANAKPNPWFLGPKGGYATATKKVIDGLDHKDDITGMKITGVDHTDQSNMRVEDTVDHDDEHCRNKSNGKNNGYYFSNDIGCQKLC